MVQEVRSFVIENLSLAILHKISTLVAYDLAK